MTPLELKRYYSSEEFKNKYIYNEKDLGITYLKDKTVFKLGHQQQQKLLLDYIMLEAMKKQTLNNLIHLT